MKHSLQGSTMTAILLTALLTILTGCITGTQQQSVEQSENISQNDFAQENQNFEPLDLEDNSFNDQALNNKTLDDDENFMNEPIPNNITNGKVDKNFQRPGIQNKEDNALTKSGSVKNAPRHWFGYRDAWSSDPIQKDPKQPWFEKQGSQNKNQQRFRKHFSFENGGHDKTQYRAKTTCPVFQEASSQSRVRFQLRKGQMIHAIKRKGGWLQIGDNSFIHELSVTALKPRLKHSQKTLSH